MVKLNKIYTRTGDAGTTGLVDGSRTPKHAPRMAAVGDVDEANSAIGVAIVALRAAETMTKCQLELGGKNALILYPDADIERAIAGAVAGMCFTWCGQACSSTTRKTPNLSVWWPLVLSFSREVWIRNSEKSNLF